MEPGKLPVAVALFLCLTSPTWAVSPNAEELAAADSRCSDEEEQREGKPPWRKK